MTLEQIIQIELVPTSRTIKEYTTDNFIRSYAEQIEAIEYPREKVKLLLLTNKLIEWYKDEIPKIEKDKYIYNKESHVKSFIILKELNNYLTNYVVDLD